MHNPNWKLTNYKTGQTTCDKFHQSKTVAANQCTDKMCKGSMMSLPGLAATARSKDDVKNMAKEFLDEFFASINSVDGPSHIARWEEVQDSINATGTYRLKEPELVFGTKLAWRNASRCIGRIQWNKLKVFDAQDVTTPRQMFEAMCTHISYATNNGNIRSTITIFPQREEGKKDFRVWNPQLIAYAGYRNEDGTITGDPINVEFTKVCMKLGWNGARTMWDILPLVLSSGGDSPEVFDIPNEIVLQVPLTHPTYWWFKDLNLRWYSLPAVSGMLFDVGGIQFPACPFNGWYMSTEVGCRDLCDPQRYNVLEMVAAEMGEDTGNDASLWKDRALVEVNVAVLHSFQQKTITIVDHHTASDNFVKHLENEQRVRKGCPADWVWIVPPMSGSLTSVYHQEMALYNVKPSYDYQIPAWRTHDWGASDVPACRFKLRQIARVVQVCTRLYKNAMKRRINLTILYATETGKSQIFADKVAEIFAHGFNPNVCCMEDYDMNQLEKEELVLIVTSTFGNGEAPSNGIEFARKLNAMKCVTSNGKTVKTENNNEIELLEKNTVDLQKLKYSVFALGSSVYPNFCAFGHNLDKLLLDLGAKRLLPVAEGDEMSGQQKTFRKWFSEVYPVACESFGLGVDKAVLEKELSAFEVKLTENSVRFVSGRGELTDAALSKSVKKNVQACQVLRKTQLHKEGENGNTILIELSSNESYRPGDHVGVIPENRPELVEAVIARLAGPFNPNKIVKLQVLSEKKTGRGTIRTWSPYGTLPTCSMRELLTRYLDLTTPLRSAQLEALAALTTHEEHQARLLELASDSTKYEAWRCWRLPTVLDVLDEFPSVRVVPAILVTILKPLLPRFYSISSSNVICKGEIHLTVAVVKYKSEGGSGPTRYGVCSNYLNDVKPGDDIYMFVRHAHNFALPLDVSKPLIMVGPGTGIAPFRGFWQQRKAQLQFVCTDEAKKEFGPAWLFFGCRNRAMDLYNEEKLAMVKEGVLERVFLALSREPTIPKTYVQTLLEREGAAVYRKLHHEGGHFYVCGDVGMAEGVNKMLLVIAQQHGQMDEKSAENFIKLLKEENRYHEDIFGVTTPSTARTATVLVSSGSEKKPGRQSFIGRVFCCPRGV